MTLEERIHQFINASTGQDDDREPSEIVDQMTPSELLSEISDALKHAGISFNLEF